MESEDWLLEEGIENERDEIDTIAHAMIAMFTELDDAGETARKEVEKTLEHLKHAASEKKLLKAREVAAIVATQCDDWTAMLLAHRPRAPGRAR